MKHLDAEIDDAITRLLEKLISWERMTGRQSVLILRENNGEMPGQEMTEPGFALRAVNGIPLGRDSDDLTDEWILKPFKVASQEE